MMNLTRNQMLALGSLGLGLLAGGGSTLTELFGQGLATKIAASAGFLNSFVSGAILILSGQIQQIKDVSAMPGVERISVNTSANQALAQVATDPTQPKVGATDAGTRATLQDTAKGV